MEIPVWRLVVSYSNIGDNNAQSNNPEEIGIGQLLNIENLSNMSFNDVAKRIKPFLDMKVNNPSLIAIKFYMELGVEGIYNFNAKDGKNITLVKNGGNFLVIDGNHRVLALVLLGEKNINVGRGYCQMGRYINHSI